MHVVPVLLGGGTPLFSTLASAIRLERTNLQVTPAATHLGFRVLPSPMTRDDFAAHALALLDTNRDRTLVTVDPAGSSRGARGVASRAVSRSWTANCGRDQRGR